MTALNHIVHHHHSLRDVGHYAMHAIRYVPDVMLLQKYSLLLLGLYACGQLILLLYGNGKKLVTHYLKSSQYAYACCFLLAVPVFKAANAAYLRNLRKALLGGATNNSPPFVLAHF